MESDNCQGMHNDNCVRRIGLSQGDSTTTEVVRNVCTNQGKTECNEFMAHEELSQRLPEGVKELFEKTKKGVI